MAHISQNLNTESERTVFDPQPPPGASPLSAAAAASKSMALSQWDVRLDACMGVEPWQRAAVQGGRSQGQIAVHFYFSRTRGDSWTGRPVQESGVRYVAPIPIRSASPRVNQSIRQLTVGRFVCDEISEKYLKKIGK